MKKPDDFTFITIISLFLIPVAFFSTCKSKPEALPTELLSAEAPEPVITFDRVEAENPVHLNLYFALNIENPLPAPCDVKIESWRAELNGKPAGADGAQALQAGFSLEEPSNPVFNAAPGRNSFPLRLAMNVDALKSQGLAPADNYDVKLVIKLSFPLDSAPPELRESLSAENLSFEVTGAASFPGVRPPVFTITAIAILKAELINTRFRVSLNIDNPNPFPVDLSAFGYDLYGNGRLWADGLERNILRVNGKSSLKGDLYLLMNFIDMKRDLLDQIIALKDVNYRFKGSAQVSSNVDYLPKFTTGFDLSGYSVVLDK